MYFAPLQRRWTSEIGVRVSVLGLLGHKVSIYYFLVCLIFARILIFVIFGCEQQGKEDM